jgi:hypothetical protein
MKSIKYNHKKRRLTMKSLSKLVALVAGITALSFATFNLSPVLADSPGQLTGGSNVFLVKNITKNGTYASTASATCNEELQYSARLHNAAYGGLTNVQVKVNLANGTLTAVPAEGASAGTTGNVSVNITSGGSLAYENGTTILYDVNGTAIKTLSDTITASGVNVGNINGSTTEFVNFKAKVSCPTPPVTPPVTPPQTSSTTTLPNTGPGDMVALFAGVSTVGAAGHYMVSRRRRN